MKKFALYVIALFTIFLFLALVPPKSIDQVNEEAQEPVPVISKTIFKAEINGLNLDLPITESSHAELSNGEKLSLLSSDWSKAEIQAARTIEGYNSIGKYVPTESYYVYPSEICEYPSGISLCALMARNKEKYDSITMILSPKYWQENDNLTKFGDKKICKEHSFQFWILNIDVKKSNDIKNQYNYLLAEYLFEVDNKILISIKVTRKPLNNDATLEMRDELVNFVCDFIGAK